MHQLQTITEERTPWKSGGGCLRTERDEGLRLSFSNTPCYNAVSVSCPGDNIFKK